MLGRSIPSFGVTILAILVGLAGPSDVDAWSWGLVKAGRFQFDMAYMCGISIGVGVWTRDGGPRTAGKWRVWEGNNR